jgi:hypothetical protein
MKHTNEEVRKAIAKHLADNPGETYKAVARRIGCSMSTIYHIAKEYGIKRRPVLGIERIVRLHISGQKSCKQCGDLFVPEIDCQMWCGKCNCNFLKEAMESNNG